MKKFTEKGFTFVELMISAAIMGIVGLAIATFLSTTFKNLNKNQNAIKIQSDVRGALLFFSQGAEEANLVSTATAVIFEIYMDITDSPNYNPDTGSVHGIPNKDDPDLDGDATNVIQTSKTGYNLADDDDDNENHIDVRRKYYLEQQADGSYWLKADMSVNEDAYGSRVMVLMKNVMNTNVFSYFGSKNEDLGMNLDKGNDGLPSTSDTGENDGIISSIEMDKVTSAQGGKGNGNGSLDIQDERDYITSARIYLEIDKNKDGVKDYDVSMEIYLPLVIAKRKVKTS